MNAQERLNALKRIPLLAGLPHGELEHLADQIQVCQFNLGDELIREGTSGSTVYFIASGRCEVRRKAGDTSVRLAFLEPGDFFGELSIVDPAPRTATVTAFEPVTALLLNGYQFRAALQNHREMSLHLVSVLAARLRQVEDEFAPRLRATA